MGGRPRTGPMDFHQDSAAPQRSRAIGVRGRSLRRNRIQERSHRRGRPKGARPGGGRSGPSRRLAEIAPIVVAGREVGIVAVPGNPPPASIVMRQLGPTLAWVAAGLLVAGSAIMALVIFRPTHKRLRMLEHAAAALGEGRTDVRAEETGGDEVSALARTFNRMADDLGARAAALAESDRARRQLLADVSHELMTPLAAIRGYTETLAMPELTLDSETRQRYLSIIGDETQKLEAMIGDLLDLARLEGGGGVLARDRVRVLDLFGRVTDRHGPIIRDRQITVVVNVRSRDADRHRRCPAPRAGAPESRRKCDQAYASWWEARADRSIRQRKAS